MTHRGPRGQRWSTAWTMALLGGAPATVVLALLLLEDVVATFLLYHVVVCLVVPYAASRRRGWNLRRHLRYVGLERSTHAWGWRVGAGLGLLSGALILLGARWAVGAGVLEPLAAQASLSAWGVTPGILGWLVPYMLVVNTAAEELYWRGALQTRLATALPRGQRLVLTNLAYASYHVVVLDAISGRLDLALAVTMVIFAAGLLWAYLREAFRSLWPAIWAHGGAVAGYMLAYAWFVL